MSEARQLKRDRKAYQQTISQLEQQLAQAAQQTKKKTKEAEQTHESLWELKRERLIDEERDQFYQDLALGACSAQADFILFSLTLCCFLCTVPYFLSCLTR